MRKVPCPVCDATGKYKGLVCQTCGGEGWVSEDGELWTPTDVCKYLQISPRTLDNHITNGQIPSPRMVGKLRRWKRDQIVDTSMEQVA